jgi:hypothetical protein
MPGRGVIRTTRSSVAFRMVNGAQVTAGYAR